MARCMLATGAALLVLLLMVMTSVHRNNAGDTSGQYIAKSYKCVNDTCIISKSSIEEKENNGPDGSIDVCRLNCGYYGSLWPKPSDKTVIGKSINEFSIDNIKFDTSLIAEQLSKEYMTEASQVFISSLKKHCIPNCVSYATKTIISIITSTPFEYIKLTTDESYYLKITTKEDQIVVKIEAKTVYGARNGLETLLQLIATYGSNDSGKSLVIASDVEINDRPKFAYRGFMLDTARHYFPISTIKRHIDAMGHSKLNTFHWHATDSHSFPLVLPNAPQMSQYGAYSSAEIYTYQEIKDLLRYALVRGVRIIMEIDSPAHAGNGWQWGKAAGYGDMAVCVNKGPWKKYCVQPPCGQLNPINDNTYKWLGKIYKDLINIFPNGEAFHMGGDEVSIKCWNLTTEITDWMKTNNLSLEIDSFTELWAQFHAKSLSEYDKEAGNSNSDIIVWTSNLTKPQYIEKYLDKRRYTIEVWEDSNVPKDLVKLGYKVIVAVKDFYYLDHGFWRSTKYHSWRSIYDNELPEVDNPSLLLGAETCMWSEYVDNNGVDSRVWPRAAALAERLWSNPIMDANTNTEYRLDQHRKRLIILGINADVIMPEWCYNHEGECII